MQCVSITYVDADSNEVDTCVWRRTEPTAWMFIIYGFIVPVLACFGFCANFINAIVFMRPKMTPSAFSYLAALSVLDCVSCVLILLTGLSRSLLFNSYFWLEYDFQWQPPLFGITTGAANLVLACVSVDRLVYLWHGIPNPCGSPWFCKRQVARRMIALVIVFSIAVNFPYFFVFLVREDGTFKTTDFYCSTYYMVHNWMTFMLLTVIPAIFLLIGNGAILVAFRRWTKQSQKICQNSNVTQKRFQHQMKLTVTILIVITLFMIGELPAHLTSRKSAVNLLYGGDINRVNFELMDRLEVICITLNVVQLSLNIIVYSVINPSFMPEFFSCLRGASDKCFKFMGITAVNNLCKRYCCSCCSKADRRDANSNDCAENANKRHHDSEDDSWSRSNSDPVATVEGCCRHLRSEGAIVAETPARVHGSWKLSTDYTYDNHASELNDEQGVSSHPQAEEVESRA